jgi:hypothetical protein
VSTPPANITTGNRPIRRPTCWRTDGQRPINEQIRACGRSIASSLDQDQCDECPEQATYAARTGSADRTTPGKGDVYDGFARRYVPGEMDMIMSNPDIVLHDYLGQDGKADYSNLEGDLSRYAGDSLDLYNLLIGGNMDPPPTRTTRSSTGWRVSLAISRRRAGPPRRPSRCSASCTPG